MAAVQVTSANNNNIDNGNRVCVRTSAGIPYVVLVDATDGSIEVWKGNSSTPTSWTEQDTANNPDATTYGSVSAAIDSTGIIHIVFMEYISKSDDLEYITFNTNTDVFAGAETINADLGVQSISIVTLYTAIAIDSNDIPHIAYVGVEANAGSLGKVVRYNNRIGGAWNTSGVEVEGQTSNLDCTYPDIAITNENIPVISYTNSENSELCRAVGNLNDATSFTLIVLDTSALNSGRTSICVDNLNNIYVAGLDSDGKVMVYNGTTQRLTTNSGGDPSILWRSSGLYLFYTDSAQDIVYQVSTDGGVNWSTKTVLETGTLSYARARWSTYANFNARPTVALNTPTNTQEITDTTPDLKFTGTDTDTYIDYVFRDNIGEGILWNTLTVSGDTIDYEIQVDTVNTFDSLGVVTGSPAIDGDTTSSASLTRLNTINPVSTAGTITVVEIFAALEMTGVKVGTFYGSGTSWQCRSFASLGTVTAGSKQRFTGLSITAEVGDILGIYYTSGSIESTTAWTTSVASLFRSADNFSNGVQTYTSSTKLLSFCSVGTIISAVSDEHTGFSAGASHPTASGVEQTYTVQSDLTVPDTYYWRVRAKDPFGSNTFGEWSSVYSFDLADTGHTPLDATPNKALSLSGIGVSLLYGRKLDATPNKEYTLDGKVVSFNKGILFDITTGSFLIDPVSSIFTTQRAIPTAVLELILSLKSSEFAKNSKLNTNVGTIVHDGKTIELLRSALISAELYEASLSGISNSYLYNKYLSTDVLNIELVGIPPQLINNHPLNAVVGALTLNGIVSELLHNKTFNANITTFSMSGSALLFAIGKAIDAGVGAFSVQGINNLLSRTYQLTTTVNATNLSGKQLDFYRGLLTTIDSLSLSLSGINTGLFRGRMVSVNTGELSMAGQAVELLQQKILTAAVLDFLVSGIGISFSSEAILNASTNALSMALIDAALIYARLFSPTVTTFSTSNPATSLHADRLLQAVVQTYTYSGINSTFIRDYALATTVAGIVVDALSTGILAGRKLSPETVSVLISGKVSLFDRTRVLTADVFSLVLSGIAVGILKLGNQTLIADVYNAIVAMQNNLLSYGRYMPAVLSQLSLGLQDTGLQASRMLNISKYNTSISGLTTGLKSNRLLLSAVGAVTVSGQGTTFNVDRLLSAIKSSFGVEFVDALLSYIPLTSYNINAVTGEITIGFEEIMHALFLLGQQDGVRVKGRGVIKPIKRQVITPDFSIVDIVEQANRNNIVVEDQHFNN